MNVIFNGEPRRLADQVTVADLLAELEFSPRQVAVEVNRAVVPREHHAEHRLQPGDEIEIVSLVGGG